MKLLFESAQHGVIIKGAALYNDVVTEILDARWTDDLIKCVFNDADRETGGNIFDGSAILLGLFDRRIHKDGATASEIDRAIGEEPLFGKILDGIAECVGKGLEEAAASRGTGFVEEDVINRSIFDFKAFLLLN